MIVQFLITSSGILLEPWYLAVDDEVADAAGEVFVLELGVDVGHVLVYSSQLQHLRPIQMPGHRSELLLTSCKLMKCSIIGH